MRVPTPALCCTRLKHGKPKTLAGIRQVASASFVYDVSPGGYCGCYFKYETPEEFAAHLAERAANPDLSYAGTPEQAETMWRSQTDAVNSFGRYLAAHPEARLAVYVVWEQCAGRKTPHRAEVPPSYFGGSGFERLPDDLLLNIVPESADGANPRWEPTARRTHEWLGCESDCG